jgi:hypothetical protein
MAATHELDGRDFTTMINPGRHVVDISWLKRGIFHVHPTSYINKQVMRRELGKPDTTAGKIGALARTELTCVKLSVIS